MKLQTRQIEGFLKSPPKEIRAILVYGPDAGLVRERAKTLSLLQVPDLNDPFNAAHLTGEIIAGDPVRFLDEANAQSLMGGKRLLRITDAGNETAAPLKNWLKDNPSPDTLIVIEAGDLKPRDALRKNCEDAALAAALPCYVEDERALTGFIRDALREHGMLIAADAAAYLASSVKGDRGRARMEVEKLILFMGRERNVTLEDVRQSCGETGLYSLDDLTFAFTGANRDLAMRALRVLMEEGSEAVMILRALQNHVTRFHQVKVLIEQHNLSAEEAIKSLQPPVFFKAADQFKAQIPRWSARRCRMMLERLNDVEARVKQTGAPTETLLSQLILAA